MVCRFVGNEWLIQKILWLIQKNESAKDFFLSAFHFALSAFGFPFLAVLGFLFTVWISPVGGAMRRGGLECECYWRLWVIGGCGGTKKGSLAAPLSCSLPSGLTRLSAFVCLLCCLQLFVCNIRRLHSCLC